MSKNDTTVIAQFRVQDAANHLLLSSWADDDHNRDWHYKRAMEQLAAAADALGHDMVPRQPVAPVQPLMSGTDAAVRDVLRATADAGYMSAADYVALNQEPPAVTGQPGFDGRDITMRDKQ